MTSGKLVVFILGVMTLALAIACSQKDTTEERALWFAAEALCPEAPEEVFDDLRFFSDSGVPLISAKSTNDRAQFLFPWLELPVPHFGPINRAGIEYQESMPTSCFDGPTPTHRPTLTPLP